MVDATRKSAYILCITDAFTKYVVVTTISNKAAQTVATAVFQQWFCKFGILVQIHTDGGKEFVNKLMAKLCELLNVQHSKMTPYHPQLKLKFLTRLLRNIWLPTLMKQS
jgi:transposase InsO family protein